MLNITGLIGETPKVGGRGSPPATTGRQAPAVVVWNVTGRCNLSCAHCYAASKDVAYRDELSGEEAKGLMDELVRMGVKALVLSGGEPLLREDLLELARYGSSRGLAVALSTNGTLITDSLAGQIRDSGIYYVGISIDGDEPTHDGFRGRAGSFRAALGAIRASLRAGLKVGIRLTLTSTTLPSLPYVAELALKEGCHRLYLSHLVYVGRGRRLIAQAPSKDAIRLCMDWVFSFAEGLVAEGYPLEVVTGNNDADGVYLYLRYSTERPVLAARIRDMLARRGGGSAGRLIASIDSRGNLYPDQYWQGYPLGNIRERPLSELWTGGGAGLLDELRSPLGRLKGRCALCIHRGLCGGNSRIRAKHFYGELWAEDPACYLTDQERGITEKMEA